MGIQLFKKYKWLKTFLYSTFAFLILLLSLFYWADAFEGNSKENLIATLVMAVFCGLIVTYFKDFSAKDRKQYEQKKIYEKSSAEEKLKNQIENYDTLPMWKSYRGEAALTMLLLMFLNMTLGYFGIVSFTTAMIALLVFLPLAFFVHSGHRWAMITAMILWTLDRLSVVIITGKLALPIIIFWLILIYPLYKALEVENERRKTKENAK